MKTLIIYKKQDIIISIKRYINKAMGKDEENDY